MTQYIPKSAVVAEIKRRIKINKECMLGLKNLDYYQGRVDAFNDALSFLNTIEVKEVDLEEEYKNFVMDDPVLNAFDSMGMILARHFYELGLKAKGE